METHAFCDIQLDDFILLLFHPHKAVKESLAYGGLSGTESVFGDKKINNWSFLMILQKSKISAHKPI